MRGFAFGLVLFAMVATILLSVRPGGLRVQLRQVGRRFRLTLVLAGIYLLASIAAHLAFTNPLSDWAPSAVAVVLGVVFVVMGQDSISDRHRAATRSRMR
jgi:hypothetical protein